eukprot:1141052-Pelagomonas_calceolata.AAC.1
MLQHKQQLLTLTAGLALCTPTGTSFELHFAAKLSARAVTAFLYFAHNSAVDVLVHQRSASPLMQAPFGTEAFSR